MSRFTAALVFALSASGMVSTQAQAPDAQPLRIVFQGGRTVPLEALQVKDGQFVVVAAEGGLQVGQTVPLNTASHMFGDKPLEVNRGIAELLLDDPNKAIATLEGVLESQKVTASVPGNFWVESARAVVLAYAINLNQSKVDGLLKELDKVSTAKGRDTLRELAAALMLPAATKVDDRVAAFNALINDASPTDVAAYATYFKGAALHKARRDDEALKSYLTGPTLYPTGNPVLNGAAEFRAADFLAKKNRREEAISLLESAARSAVNTPIADAAKKRLESLK